MLVQQWCRFHITLTATAGSWPAQPQQATPVLAHETPRSTPHRPRPAARQSTSTKNASPRKHRAERICPKPIGPDRPVLRARPARTMAAADQGRPENQGVSVVTRAPNQFTGASQNSKQPKQLVPILWGPGPPHRSAHPRGSKEAVMRTAHSIRPARYGKPQSTSPPWAGDRNNRNPESATTSKTGPRLPSG